jgi:signal transduction histidine kinase
MLSGTSDLYIYYDSELLYSTEDVKEIQVPEYDTDNLGKQYIIEEKDGNTYIYVFTSSRPDTRVIEIITRRNVTDTVKILDNTARNFSLFLTAILLLSGLIIYFITKVLTRPLENLNTVTDKFAEGKFDTRSEVTSRDEVGLLSEKFNHMADSVEEHIDELEDMIHRRDQFVADFTHEIKTPMTTIIGYADIIRSVDLPREDEINAASYIYSEGRRLEQMSAHLFDLIYLKDGTVPKQPVNSVALGEAVIKTVKPSIEKAGLKLEYSFDDTTIMGDSALLATAFINLLDNARKASSKGSEVSFTGKKDGDKYRFVVEDHGIGISEEDLGKICDEFYMVDKSRSRKEGGAGLGMSLVNAIMREHGFEFSIESELGKGTRMIVII